VHRGRTPNRLRNLGDRIDQRDELAQRVLVGIAHTSTSTEIGVDGSPRFGKSPSTVIATRRSARPSVDASRYRSFE